MGSLNGPWAVWFKLQPAIVTLGLALLGFGYSEIRSIHGTMSELLIRQAVMESNMPKENPPKWIIDRLERTERNLDKLTEQVADLTKIVAETHKTQ